MTREVLRSSRGSPATRCQEGDAPRARLHDRSRGTLTPTLKVRRRVARRSTCGRSTRSTPRGRSSSWTERRGVGHSAAAPRHARALEGNPPRRGRGTGVGAVADAQRGAAAGDISSVSWMPAPPCRSRSANVSPVPHSRARSTHGPPTACPVLAPGEPQAKGTRTSAPAHGAVGASQRPVQLARTVAKPPMWSSGAQLVSRSAHHRHRDAGRSPPPPAPARRPPRGPPGDRRRPPAARACTACRTARRRCAPPPLDAHAAPRRRLEVPRVATTPARSSSRRSAPCRRRPERRGPPRAAWGGRAAGRCSAAPGPRTCSRSHAPPPAAPRGTPWSATGRTCSTRRRGSPRGRCCARRRCRGRSRGSGRTARRRRARAPASGARARAPRRPPSRAACRPP